MSCSSHSPQSKGAVKGHLRVPMPLAQKLVPEKPMPSWPGNCLQLCTASAIPLQTFTEGLLAFPMWILAWMDISTPINTHPNVHTFTHRGPKQCLICISTSLSVQVLRLARG